VSTIVHVPEDLASRLTAEAARLGVSIDELSADLIAAGLSGEDPLEAFIGSIRSGRGDLGRRHREIKTELTEGLAAREL
jgi:plasmid stability protein